MKLAIANQTKWMNFPDVANFHGAPYDVCPDQGSKGCCPHIGDSKNIHAVMDFLPWHRLYLGMIPLRWLKWSEIGLATASG